MSKRSSEIEVNGTGPKRQKVQHRNPPPEVKSADHLRELLAFRQDAVAELLTGIRSFKVLLEAILYTEDKETIADQQITFAQYIASQQPRNDGDVPFEQLFQAWSFAAKVNHDSLSSAVPAILALLLRAVSHDIELLEVGLALGKAVLRDDHLKLVTRGLGVAKEKEHIISPSIRLLSEVAAFDGGSLISRIHAARHATVDPKLLTRCLTIGATSIEDAHSRLDRPTVRSNCIRYFITLLKFSSPQGKRELLRSASVLKALLHHLRQDGPGVLSDLFGTLLEHVLKDEKVPFGTKTALLSDEYLSSIAALLRPEPGTTPSEATAKQADHAHKFLKQVCTTSDLGLLRSSGGYYPPGTERVSADQDGGSMIDLGLDSVSWYNRYDHHVPVLNGHLAKFVKSLKPYASLQDCDLAVSIFNAAPELIADYFRTSRFSLDPKLTATWIGYIAFLFSSIQVPVPRFFGRPDGYAQVPPPASVVLDNILPTPMNQKVTTRCLNQSSELITLSTVRLLNAALQKLQKVLSAFDEASEARGPLWQEGKDRLVEGVIERLPALKDVISVFQKSNVAKSVEREAILRLLRLYYEVLPQLAADHKFDVSLPLNQLLSVFAMGESEDAHGSLETRNHSADQLQSTELDHLLSIAVRTPETRWFHKPESPPFSPFTCLLRVQSSNKRSEHFRDILLAICAENDLMDDVTLDASTVSLSPTSSWMPLIGTLKWLDDAVQRYIRKSIKYQDDLDELFDGSEVPSSALWMVLKEQLPFALEKPEAAEDIVQFVCRFLEASRAAGIDMKCLSTIRKALTGVTKPKSDAHRLLSSQDCHDKQEITEKVQQTRNTHSGSDIEQEPIINSEKELKILDADLFTPSIDPSESKDVVATLHSVSTTPLEDLQEAVQSGAVSRLLLCLSSSDHDVHTSALTNIRALMKRLSGSQAESQFPPAKQIWLLLGVLENTVREHTKSRSGEVGGDHSQGISSVVTGFAAMTVPILAEPTHPLYEPINKVLLRGPTFKDTRMLQYWLHRTLREAPPESAYRQPRKPQSFSNSADTDLSSVMGLTPLPLTALPSSYAFPGEPYHTSIHFFLSYIYHSIRTTQDLEVLRRSSGVLESVLSITSSDPFLARGLRELVMAIIWRITHVEGGSDVLITRVGIVSWLAMMISMRGAGKGPTDLVGREALRQLMRRMWETCDQEGVRRWDGGAVDNMREAMGEEEWAKCKTRSSRSKSGVEAAIEHFAGESVAVNGKVDGDGMDVDEL